jgi:mono/diheme cytochrome c family protein
MINKSIRSAVASAAFAAVLLSSCAQGAEGDVARGKYLVTIGICGSCHTPNYSGGRKVGPLISANITSDKASGIGSWTEEEIITALREGIRPDGTIVRPPMGVFFYKGLTIVDAYAIAAFLKQTPPVATTFQRPPAPRAMPGTFITARLAEMPRTDKVAYGEYLAVTVAHCMQCHSPRTPDGLPDLARMGAGGNGYTGRDGRTALSANITPGNPTGIATWTDAQVKEAITKGVRPDGSKLVPVMDFDLYEQMTPDDLDSLVAFLRTLKPVPPA